MRAIRVGIFEDKGFGNCSNHGISERYDHILLEHEHGNVLIDEENPPENLCKVVARRIGDRVVVHVEPVADTDDGCVGWMFGGCLVYTSDGRFGGEPLRLHDRQEEQALYERLSR